MALIGSLGPLDLDTSDLRRPYDVVALDGTDTVVKTWSHDGARPLRIQHPGDAAATLFLRKGTAEQDGTREGTRARIMCVPS